MPIDVSIINITVNCIIINPRLLTSLYGQKLFLRKVGS